MIPDPEDTGVSPPEEEPTEVDAVHEEPETQALPPDSDPETSALPPDSDPETSRLHPDETGSTQVRPSMEQPPPRPGSGGSWGAGFGGATGTDDGSGRRAGITTLIVSIFVSLALVGSYIAAGGLDYKPTGAADPCDARPWTDPQNLEDSAQQFVLSASDGAACELGVSREELIRALADDASRQQFAEDHDLSDSEIEDGLRAGLDRAVDDAHDAGAIGGLTATALHAGIKIAPMSVLLDLFDNAEQVFQDGGLDSITGSLGGIGGIGDALDSITGGNSGDTGTTGTTGAPDSGASGIGGALDDAIPDDLKKQLDQNLPEGTTRKDLEQQLNDAASGILGQ